MQHAEIMMEAEQTSLPLGPILSAHLKRIAIFFTAFGGSCWIAGFQLWQFPYPRTALMYAGAMLLILALVTWVCEIIFRSTSFISSKFSSIVARFTIMAAAYALAIFVTLYQLIGLVVTALYLGQVGTCVMKNPPICSKEFTELSADDKVLAGRLTDTKYMNREAMTVIYDT